MSEWEVTWCPEYRVLLYPAPDEAVQFAAMLLIGKRLPASCDCGELPYGRG